MRRDVDPPAQQFFQDSPQILPVAENRTESFA